MSATLYSPSNVSLGDKVRLDGETDWAEVTAVSPTEVELLYDNGNVYGVDWDLVHEVTSGTTPVQPATPQQPVSTPDLNLPVQPMDNKAAAPVAVTVPAAMETALVEHQKNLKVEPGVIVTYKHSARKRMHKDRLWVVLSYTKNTNQQEVNICPVNGDPAYSHAYSRVAVGDCTPVKFRALIHTRALKG